MKYLILLIIIFSFLPAKSQLTFTLNQHDTSILVIYEPDWVDSISILCNDYSKLYAIGSIQHRTYLVGWIEKDYHNKWEGQYHLQNQEPNLYVINFKSKEEAQNILNKMREGIMMKRFNDSTTILKNTYKKCDQ